MMKHIRITSLLAILICSFIFATPLARAADDAGKLSEQVLFGSDSQRAEAVAQLEARGNPDAAAALILALRYRRGDADIDESLRRLTGHRARGWFEWMLWQEENADIVPHPSFANLKLAVFGAIDPEFQRFLNPGTARRDRMRIRLEEISWGGVRVDGIPPLDNPPLIAADDADYLRDDDLVFGISINGDARAYPLRIMGWHEMFNETIGGVPVALAYCTLCGAGILFETAVAGYDTPFVFSSSGFLYRSNKLMYDRQTDSLWNQFTGEPVVGPLVDSEIRLNIRPVVTTTWAKWRSDHPETKVLSLDTGFQRDYGSGVVYRDYFASADLMFPALVDQSNLRQKDRVFGIRDVAAAKAWPLEAFRTERVINDQVGLRSVVLIGDATTRTVRAYDRKGHRFRAEGDDDLIDANGSAWRITEDALVPENGGERLVRVPGHLAYWFAWDGYLGVESELYATGDDRG